MQAIALRPSATHRRAIRVSPSRSSVDALLLAIGILLLVVWSVGAAGVGRGRPLDPPQPRVAPTPVMVAPG